METWFLIRFANGTQGYIHLIAGFPQAVYRSNGEVVTPDEIVEYTCVNDNVDAPSWYVPPQTTEN